MPYLQFPKDTVATIWAGFQGHMYLGRDPACAIETPQNPGAAIFFLATALRTATHIIQRDHRIRQVASEISGRDTGLAPLKPRESPL